MKTSILFGALAATGMALTTLTAAPAAAAAADPILTGKRQVVIKPIPSFESIVAIDGTGRLNLTDGQPEYGLFVLRPVGGKYQIRTAKPGDGRKAACIGIRNNGSNPLTAVATTCDHRRPGQLFSLVEQAGKDNGRPTYAIHNNWAYLQNFPRTGLIAEELGEGPLLTTFSFVDNGPAPTLPQ